MASKTLYSIIVDLQGGDKAKAGLQSLAVQSGVAATALGALAVKARQSALEYGTALDKFNTIATENTGSIETQKVAFDQLTGSLNNSLTATDALNAGYEILSSGYDNLNDVTGILNASQRAAVGGFSDVKTVADAATTALNVYGNTYGEAATVTEKTNDILSQAIQVQNLGKITVNQYAQSIGVLLPTARAANVGLDELNGIIALTTANGIQAETAIRGYRQLLVNLIRPTAQATEAAKANGIEIGNQALQTKGFRGVLEDIITASKSNPDVISQVFTDVDSLNVANVLAQNSDKLDEFIEKVGDSKGVLDEQFAIVNEGDAAKQQRLLNLLNEAFRDLGIGVVNTLEPVISILSELIKGFSSLDPAIKSSVGSITLLVAAGLGLTATFVQGRLALLAVQEALKATGISAGALAAQFAPLALAAALGGNLVNVFQNVQRAAENTAKGTDSLRAATDNLNKVLAESDNGEIALSGLDKQIERTNEKITESVNIFQRGIDQIIKLIRSVGVPIQTALNGALPLLNAVEKITGFKIPKISDLVTSEEAAIDNVNERLKEQLQLTTDVREANARRDLSKLGTSELEAVRDELFAAKDALQSTDIQNTGQAEERDREVLLLDEQIKRVVALTDATDKQKASRVELADATVSAADAEAKLLDEVKKSASANDAKLSNELKLIEAQKQRGEISDIDAIQQSATLEANATDSKIRDLERLLEADTLTNEQRADNAKKLADLQKELDGSSVKARIAEINGLLENDKLSNQEREKLIDGRVLLESGALDATVKLEEDAIKAKIKAGQELVATDKVSAEARAKIDAELADLRVKAEADAAAKQIQINDQKLKDIDELRDRELAKIDASGLSEIEAARLSYEAKAKFSQQSITLLQAEINSLSQNSDRRIDLETKVFQTQAAIAKERKALADQELASKLEAIATEEKLATNAAKINGNPEEVARAELEAINQRVAALKEILAIEGLSAENRQKLQLQLSDSEVSQVEKIRDINRSASEERIQQLEDQITLQQGLVDAQLEQVQASQNLISANSSLLSTLASGLDSVKSPLENLSNLYDKAGDSSKRLADIDKDRSQFLQDQRLQDIEVPEGATDAQKAQIEAENNRRQAARDQLEEQRKLAEFEEKRLAALAEERERQKEIAKAEAEATTARQQLAIINQNLAQFGVQVNATGDIGKAIEQAKLQIQILQLDAQSQLNALKLEEQRITQANAKLEQESLIAQQNLAIASGTLTDPEIAQAQLKIQLATQQLDLINQQNANLARQGELEQRNVGIQRQLLQAQAGQRVTPLASNPTGSGSSGSLAASNVASEAIKQSISVEQAKVVDAVNAVGGGIGNLESSLSSINSATNRLIAVTQQLPSQLARAIPRPVVPK